MQGLTISPTVSPVTSPVNSPKSIYTTTTLPLSDEKNIYRTDYHHLSKQTLLNPITIDNNGNNNNGNGIGSITINSTNNGNNGTYKYGTEMLYNQINLEKLLADKGYQIIRKVVVDKQKLDCEGTMIIGKIVESIKVLTPTGKMVYITLDGDNDDAIYVTFSHKDITMIKRDSVGHFPFSERRGLNELLGLGLAGIAIDCDGDICFLRKQDDGKVHEVNYVLNLEALSKHEREKELTFLCNAYPIIRYADLYHDFNKLMKNIDEAAARIADKERITCNNSIVDYSKAVAELNTTSTAFMQTFKSFQTTLTTNLANFQHNLDYYRSNPPRDQESLDMYNTSLEGLKYSDAKFNDLIQGCNQLQLNMKIESIYKIIADINQQTNYLKANPITIFFS
jgi:hypothetical protein